MKLLSLFEIKVIMHFTRLEMQSSFGNHWNLGLQISLAVVIYILRIVVQMNLGNAPTLTCNRFDIKVL